MLRCTLVASTCHTGLPFSPCKAIFNWLTMSLTELSFLQLGAWGVKQAWSRQMCLSFPYISSAGKCKRCFNRGQDGSNKGKVKDQLEYIIPCQCHLSSQAPLAGGWWWQHAFGKTVSGCMNSKRTSTAALRLGTQKMWSGTQLCIQLANKCYIKPHQGFVEVEGNSCKKTIPPTPSPGPTPKTSSGFEKLSGRRRVMRICWESLINIRQKDLLGWWTIPLYRQESPSSQEHLFKGWWPWGGGSIIFPQMRHLNSMLWPHTSCRPSKGESGSWYKLCRSV